MTWLNGFTSFFKTSECGRDSAIAVVVAFFAYLTWRVCGWASSKI